jgi:hypothetical protein
MCRSDYAAGALCAVHSRPDHIRHYLWLDTASVRFGRIQCGMGVNENGSAPFYSEQAFSPELYRQLQLFYRQNPVGTGNRRPPR